jgi:hypothetical protein
MIQHNRYRAMLILYGVMYSRLSDKMVTERPITVNHAR